MTMSALVLDHQAWVRIRYRRMTHDGPAMPDGWMTMDFDKAVKHGGAPFSYALENDPGFAGEVFEYGAGIRRTGPGHFSGVTDLSSMYGGHILSFDHENALGDKARAAPFTAVLDGQGRLTSLAPRIPAAGSGFGPSTYQVTYDQYGTATPPVAPAAGQVTPAPDRVYAMVGAHYAGPMIAGA